MGYAVSYDELQLTQEVVGMEVLLPNADAFVTPSDFTVNRWYNLYAAFGKGLVLHTYVTDEALSLEQQERQLVVGHYSRPEEEPQTDRLFGISDFLAMQLGYVARTGSYLDGPTTILNTFTKVSDAHVQKPRMIDGRFIGFTTPKGVHVGTTTILRGLPNSIFRYVREEQLLC